MATINTAPVHQCHSGTSFTAGAVVALAVQGATHIGLTSILLGAVIIGVLLDRDDKKTAEASERAANVE